MTKSYLLKPNCPNGSAVTLALSLRIVINPTSRSGAGAKIRKKRVGDTYPIASATVLSKLRNLAGKHG
jgi:hypothetical protein